MAKKIFVIPPDQIDTTRNPGYPVGNNQTRSSFTWHLNSKKGKVFQRVLKPAIIAMINRMHAWVLKSWDPEGFVYDDKRLQCLSENLHGFISTYYDHQERKLTFMHQGVDIGMFIMKEDKYYCARIFYMLNNLPIFQLTASEMVNIEHDWKAQGGMTVDVRAKLEAEAATRMEVEA